MTREEAKKLAMSRDCNCILGRDRDNNYNECVDKIFNYFEDKIKKLKNKKSKRKYIHDVATEISIIMDKYEACCPLENREMIDEINNRFIDSLKLEK
jgi:hypothetical protein